MPCSGLGVIGKKNDIKYKVTKEGIESLVSLQREILSVAGQYVKLPKTLWNDHTKEGYLQLLPGIVKTDGFFLARFRKKGGKSKEEES